MGRHCVVCGTGTARTFRSRRGKYDLCSSCYAQSYKIEFRLGAWWLLFDSQWVLSCLESERKLQDKLLVARDQTGDKP